MGWEFVPDDEGGGSYTWVSDDTDAWGGMGDWNTSATNPAVDESGFVKEIDNPSLPGQTGYGWKYYSNGTAISPEGKYYFDGKMVYDPASADKGSWGNLFSKMGDFAKTPAGMATILGTAYGMGAGNKPQTGGWKGSIPTLTATREQVKMPEYEPYSGKAVMGGKFFTDTQYTPTSNTEALQAAQTAAKTTAEKLATTNPKAPAAAVAPESYLKAAPKRDMSGLREIYRMPGAAKITDSGIALGDAEKVGPPEILAAVEPITKQEDFSFPAVTSAASGGLMDLGRYLSGPTDGMADKIPSFIDGEQPAKLSHGEFVIPADVVSHLGNGNSDAGAEQLYKMMDRVRKARTGTTEQGKKIDPEKFTPGGIAGYANGGAVAFQTGGSADTALSRTASSNLLGATQETNLAPWVGDYVGNMLGRAQALAGEGYQAYTGPLSAGTSPLQQQAFNAAGQINPQATFDTAAAQQYMNPFIEMSLKPQLEEMRRQADISRLNTAGRMAKAGAYGGGRQAIMESELLRNLGQQQALTTGKAYETAFDKAMNQYNVGRQQTLADVNALAGLGQQERQIEQQGIDQLRAEFEKQRQDPYEKLKFQQSMLQGLPVGSTTITPNTSLLSQLGLTTEQVGKFSDWLSKNVFNTPPG